MLKEKNLVEARDQIRIQDGTAVTLSTIKDALKDCANRHGVALAFENDQAKFGGLIGGATYDCLVVYHPDHKRDYYNFVVIVKYQGNYAFVSTFMTGISKQIGRDINRDQAGADFKGSFKRMVSDPDLTGAFGQLLGSGVKALFSLGRNKQKLEEERNWYAMANDIFDETFA